MLNQDFKVRFYLKKPHNYAGGETAIYMRITAQGIQKDLCTGLKCHPFNWLKEPECSDGRTRSGKELNEKLSVFRFKIFNLKMNSTSKGETITMENAINTLSDKMKPEKFVLELFKKHNERMEDLVGKDFAHGTLERYKTSLKHTQAFIEWRYNRSDLPVGKLDFEFVSDYEYWLKAVQNCSHNTTIKYISNFRKIVIHCLKTGWLTNDPFLGFSMKRKEVPIVPLTHSEVQTIKNKQFTIERVKQVRDIFIFCCYTGLSYIDVYNLTPSNIVIGSDKRKWIYFSRTKTTSGVRIPLLPDALEIINRYATHEKCIATNKLLPVLSNQKMNSYLVEIADVCGITKKITMHLARHTFATTITLNRGVPIETVSKMLGHSYLKTTQHYAKLQNEKIGNDMDRLARIIK